MHGRIPFSESRKMNKQLLQALILFSLLMTTPAVSSAATDSGVPASPEVTAAMQPYLYSYKLAGVVSLIADRSGKVHYRNLLGYADVGSKKPVSEDNVFWIA